MGAAITRNYALVRSRGQFIRNLDGDDWLLPEALQLSAEALDDDDELCFVFTGALLGEENGQLRAHPVANPHPPGRVESAAMSAFWNLGNHFGFICTTVMFRRLHLFAYGGWAALRRSEDAGVMIPMAAAHPVFYVPTPSTVYRLHPQQITRANEEHIREANILFMEQRINAASQFAGEDIPPPSPSSYPSFHTLYE